MDMGGWLGGTILYFFPRAIQLACVNCPVFKVKNNIGKLAFWRDVSYSQMLTSLWKKTIYLEKNQLN